jgi:hypothetical protein
MTMLLLGLIIALVFVYLVEFQLRPLVVKLYETYEPLVWHLNFKLKKYLGKVHEKSRKSYLKIRYFLTSLCHLRKR